MNDNDVKIRLDKKATAVMQKVVGDEPTGEISITENGDYDVKAVATAIVNVKDVPAVVEPITVNPTTSQQVIEPEEGVDGFNKITVNAVTSTIDSNIIAENIKKDVEILGVTGAYIAPEVPEYTGSYTITENGTISIANKKATQDIEVEVDMPEPGSYVYMSGGSDEPSYEVQTLSEDISYTYKGSNSMLEELEDGLLYSSQGTIQPVADEYGWELEINKVYSYGPNYNSFKRIPYNSFVYYDGTDQSVKYSTLTNDNFYYYNTNNDPKLAKITINSDILYYRSDNTLEQLDEGLYYMGSDYYNQVNLKTGAAYLYEDAGVLTELNADEFYYYGKDPGSVGSFDYELQQLGLNTNALYVCAGDAYYRTLTNVALPEAGQSTAVVIDGVTYTISRD